eukprot:17610_1
MSHKEHQTELLAFGCVHIWSPPLITMPIVLIKLIQIYYDEYFHWNLTDEKLKEFLNSENGAVIYSPKAFKIQDIICKFILVPNGKTSDFIGKVSCGLEIISLPSDIEYIGFYREFECEQLGITIKQMGKFTSDNWIIDLVCYLIDCKNFKQVNFNCFCDIQYIKYKPESNKMDYIKETIKMKRCSEYKWNIDGELMNKVKTMKLQEEMYSDNFGNNNWCLIFVPNGVSAVFTGNAAIMLNCLWIPFGIQRMKVKFTVSVSGDVCVKEDSSDFEFFINETDSCYGFWKWADHAFLFSHLKESICIHAKAEIIHLYDDNHKIIDSNEWIKFGILD